MNRRSFLSMLGLSRDSLVGQRNDHAFMVEVFDSGMDGLVERCDVGECFMGEMMRFEVMPDDFDIVEFGGVLGSHSTVSQWARAASAVSESLLTWIGPLSSTRTTGLAGRPGAGP